MHADQPLPAAPEPGGGPPNPYDFLYQSPPKKKMGSILPAGNSTKQRLIIVIGGGLTVLLIFVIVMALIFGGGGGNTANLTSVAQQQTELIRVSTEISEKSQSPATLAFAQNIEFSTTTDQQALLKYMSSHSLKVKTKTLGLTKSTQTDTTLTNADQAGNYDNVAVSTLQNLETAYQKELSTVYKTATPLQQTLLKSFFNHSVALLKNPPTVQPDTNS